MRKHLLGRDFGLLCHSLSQPGHCARQRHRHPDSHAVGALSLVHHCHVQRPATQRRTQINWLFHEHSCTDGSKTDGTFLILAFVLSDFSWRASGFDILFKAGYRHGGRVCAIFGCRGLFQCQKTKDIVLLQHQMYWSHLTQCEVPGLAVRCRGKGQRCCSVSGSEGKLGRT